MISLIQTEYFQDDVYPETRVTWEAALTSQEWLSGEDGVQSSLSLRPHDMEPCEALSNADTLAVNIVNVGPRLPDSESCLMNIFHYLQ